MKMKLNKIQHLSLAFSASCTFRDNGHRTISLDQSQDSSQEETEGVEIEGE